MVLFSKYGAVDSVSSYPSRSYAFVYFKRVEDAKKALEALHGTYLRGNSLKIEFARPAKPCKSLWVSGVGPSVTKETLEAEFLKFGEIEEFKFLRDRNTAYIDYLRLEDASQALKVMNGKQIGGNQIRVDFLRSQTIRREPGADYRDVREGQFLSRDMARLEADADHSEPTHSGFKRQQHAQSFGGRKGDEQPSNVLWIAYPPAVQVDEQMLHNALILFGEIESINSFPGSSFVEFRSVDEARRAKEGLQGRLFNDSRISIWYATSEIARSKDYPGFHPGMKGPLPDAFSNEPPLDHNRPMVPNALSRPATSRGILGPNRGVRPLGPQGSFEPLLSAPDFNDLTALHNFPDAIPSSMMGGPNWKISPPIPGMLPSPSQVAKPPIRPVSGTWDVFDANQFQRESKRPRIDNLPVYDSPFPSKKMDDRDWGLDRPYGLGPEVGGGGSGPAREKNLYSPASVRMMTRGTGQGNRDHEIWRGVIAKGGTSVCNARCVAVGKGIESEIPEVVNCSARTGLDMLTKHYAEATGCSVVFFLPDSEEDFAPYTDFLRYLGGKDRAGVAKFNDGTTLFLVPPSDFLSKVLQISGPPRLYGVVLKFPQHAPSSSPSVHPQIFQSQYPDVQEIPPQNEYTGMQHRVENAMHMDYNRVLHRESLPTTSQHAPSTKDSILMHPAPSLNAAAVSQAGVTLTPELIATLASLLPSSAKSSDPETTQPSLASSSVRPELGNATLPQSWTHDRQGYEQIGHSLHQEENQYNSQQFAQLQAYSSGLNTSTDSTLGVTGNSQVQDPAFHLPQQGAGSSRLLTNYGMPLQSGQLPLPPQVDRQYQYSSSAYNGPAHSLSNNQVHGSTATQAHTAMPLGVDKGNPQLPNQVQQLQSSGSSQGRLESEVDKNQRYQSTLQFAANLLLQIQQQQQQQTNTQVGQEPANQ